MREPSSRMEAEALEAPDAVERLLAANRARVRDLANRVRAKPPRFAVTVARGSSDHAALYAKYLIENLTGTVTASLAPSVRTVYGSRLELSETLALAFSQSGQSPDLVDVVRHARAAGALTVALLNDVSSPLAEASEVILPLHAGPEESVAATKSLIAQLAAVAQLVGAWSGHPPLATALSGLCPALRTAAQADWSAAWPLLLEADDLLVVGRGYAYPIALEAALKLKETCALHAEAFSAAELLHGPVELVEPGFPVWVFAPRDAPLEGVKALIRDLGAKRAQVAVASSDPDALQLGATALPLPVELHPALDPLLLIQAFYRFAAQLARRRGLDPDQPRHLRKVTRTR